MKNKIIILLCLLFGASYVSAENVALWFDSPANQWMQSLPVGNGRLGAMIFGGVDTEKLALNESSMWAGQYAPEQEKSFGKAKLQELRELFFQGKLVEGNQMCHEYLTSDNHSFGTHLPVGDLNIQFLYPVEGSYTNYKRVLDLDKGLHTVSYTLGNVTYTRECFASNPDDVLVMHVTANKKSSVSVEISLNLLRQPSKVRTLDNQLIFNGQALSKNSKGGVWFEGRVTVSAIGGNVQTKENKIAVSNADELILRIDIRTDYKNHSYKELCKKTIKAAEEKSYEQIKKQHITDFSALFNRVSLSLGDKRDAYQLPTSVRLKQYRENPAKDPDFVALFFQYARYLLISSSRENSPLPIALQGFFNDNLACNMAWTNDYHLDINTQQNYWLSNVGNLSECNTPLFKYIQELSVYGQRTAQNVYGCKGWTAHTVANIWGYTSPSNGIGYGLFPTASSWLASHLWTEYEYTQDRKFLKDTAYPLLKGNAEFLLDYMVEDPSGKYLLTGPSISPENSFVYNNTALSASMMPTCDRVLAYEILNSTLQSARILNVDIDFQNDIENALQKLPPIRLMANGGIREWLEDYQEAIPNHRHTTHLLSLYPFNQISLDYTPELAKGALTTIENRLSAPDWEDVEWSRANMICYYARLHKNQEAYNSINTLLEKLIRDNLFSVSPVGIAGAATDIFAIDGNQAAAAGIAEMLVQSQNGYIELLPCLPEQWDKGACTGLCIRGGGQVDFSWDRQGIKTATIHAKNDYPYRIKMPKENRYEILLNQKRIGMDPDEHGLISIPMNQGDTLNLIRL